MSQSSSTASVSSSTCSRRSPQIVHLALLEIEPPAAGPDEPATEPVAAEQRGHVEEIAADPAAERSRGQVGHVAGERAEVAGVVGQPFEFERYGSQGLRACTALEIRTGPRRAEQ